MKRDDMLDFMGGIDDKYLDEAGEMRMNSVVDATGRSKSIKRRSMIMSLKKLSIVAATLALVAGIGCVRSSLKCSSKVDGQLLLHDSRLAGD